MATHVEKRISLVPYFAQWESQELVSKFLENPQCAFEDPNWHFSGAETAEEYARWSRHLCGIACLKMILAATRYKSYPMFNLHTVIRNMLGIECNFSNLLMHEFSNTNNCCYENSTILLYKTYPIYHFIKRFL